MYVAWRTRYGENLIAYQICDAVFRVDAKELNIKHVKSRILIRYECVLEYMSHSKLNFPFW